VARYARVDAEKKRLQEEELAQKRFKQSLKHEGEFIPLMQELGVEPRHSKGEIVSEQQLKEEAALKRKQRQLQYAEAIEAVRSTRKAEEAQRSESRRKEQEHRAFVQHIQELASSKVRIPEAEGSIISSAESESVPESVVSIKSEMKAYIESRREADAENMSQEIFDEAVEDINFKLENKDKCVNLYKKMPWISDNIIDQYIYPIDSKTSAKPSVKQVGPSKQYAGFYFTKEWITIPDVSPYEIGDTTFFRVTTKFYEMRCFGVDMYIDEYNYIHVKWKGYDYVFMLAFTVANSDTPILYNTVHLDMELAYIQNFAQNYLHKEDDLMNSLAVPSDMIEIVYYMINIIFDHNINKQYVYEVIDVYKLHSVTTKKFAYDIAELLVYLNPDITFMYGKSNADLIFPKRFQKQMYVINLLPNLGVEELLPEVYGKERLLKREFKTKISLKLYEQHKETMRSIIENTLIRDKIDLRTATWKKIRKPMILRIGLPSWKSICANSIADVPDEDIVYYREGDNVYCFIIQDLLENINSGNIVNPYTNARLSDEFIQQIVSLYAYNPKYRSSKPQSKPSKSYRKGHIIRLIEDELKRLENLLMPEYFTLSELGKCAKCKQKVDDATGFASIMNNKKVSFCGTKCFEDTRW